MVLEGPETEGPEIVADDMADIIGAAINPYSRQSPESFIRRQEFQRLTLVHLLSGGRSFRSSVQADCLTTTSLCKSQDKPN